MLRGSIPSSEPPQIVDRNAVTQTNPIPAVEPMDANFNQPDDMSNVTNAGSFANQPISADHDGTSNSTNQNLTGSASKPLPGTLGTGEPTTDTSPAVVSRPNLAATPGTTLRPSRSTIQMASSRPISSLERRPTGPGLIMHDPIRGDLPYHQMHLFDTGVEEDLPDAQNRQGSRNAVGRALVSRQRSVMSTTERAVIRDGHLPGPGSRL